MIISYLKTKQSTLVDEGWAAFEIGNLRKAEDHFLTVLKHEDDPHMTIFDSVEAHNGMGAVSRSHKDFFDAWRWYKEAEYLLDQYYEKKWPPKLSWDHPHDRPALRTLSGLGHTAFARGDIKVARRYYQMILDCDLKDELGIQRYLTAIRRGEEYQGIF